jgi:peptide/nickel transport system substrate-binding protein
MTEPNETPEGRPDGVSRRQFNVMLSALLAGATLPTLVSRSYAQPASYKESPMLAERVKQGKLPPVEKRLPDEPLVLKPTNQVGTYGGKLSGAGLAPETTNDLQIGQPTGFFRFSNDLGELYPELATGYKFNTDYTECVITLRKGLKWSDGQPFGVDDVLFFFNDWKYNTDFFPATPSAWTVGGQKFGIEKIDDQNVRFKFAVPYPSFSVVQYSGPPAEPFRPAHYLKQFHKKYNPKVADEATAAGFNSWQAYFTYKAGGNGDSPHYGATNPDLPAVSPWVMVANDSRGQQYERNPYYFKVDTEGNQLPYIDTMTVEYASNPEVMNLKAVSGALSVAGLDLQLVNYPIIRRGEQAGDYATQLVYSSRGTDVAIAFNQLHKDPALNKLFGDVRFRQAMSLGINRKEINELVFLGQGTPGQATVNPSAHFYDAKWGQAFADYDLKRANALLDQLGLDKRDSGGKGLRPDGKPLTFQLEYLPQEGPKKEVCELVVKHWTGLGIPVEASARERAYLLQRLSAGDQDATAWHVDRVLERPAYAYGAGGKLGPGGNSIITYAQAWITWFNSKGEQGTEPPKEAKALEQAYLDWAKTAMGTPEYTKAAKNVYDQVAALLYVLGTVSGSPQPVVVKHNVENVIKTGEKTHLWWGADNWYWYTLHPEQWFIKA